jgi:2-polyprenyl-3-methyl-5-hydroxy-6-metoxy-1,4-benzoquinol methylase
MDAPTFWNEKWDGRIKSDGRVAMNGEKRKFILKQLIARPEFDDLKKLEIGCGPAIHAGIMEQNRPGWTKNYSGVDVSETAIEYAREVVGVDARHLDVFSLNGEFKGIQLFLFLDSLEHIQDHKRLAGKVREMASDEFTIFGNIPLYTTAEGLETGNERPVDINVLAHFLSRCGGHDIYHNVYGINGYPYLLFQCKVTK